MVWVGAAMKPQKKIINHFGGEVHLLVPPAKDHEDVNSPFLARKEYALNIIANWILKDVSRTFQGDPSALVEGADAANYGTAEWVMPPQIVIRQCLHSTPLSKYFGFAEQGDGFRTVRVLRKDLLNFVLRRVDIDVRGFPMSVIQECELKVCCVSGFGPAPSMEDLVWLRSASSFPGQ